MRASKKVKDLTGQTFGRWSVVRLAKVVRYRAMWHCQCNCGATAEIAGSSLSAGNSRSCGCYRNDVARARVFEHGMCGTRIWNTWHGMLQRCNDKTSTTYKNYGGRGIKVCEQWKSFENFYADVGDPPPNRTLDRINNNGHYEPGNWRWATYKEQSNNRRSNTWITAFGRTQTMAQWSDELGVKRATICQRISRGASNEESLRPVA